ncbi:MAG: hypothetical protein AB7V56_12770 [Candidatus Nitrosocosmicus sp.]
MPLSSIGEQFINAKKLYYIELDKPSPDYSNIIKMFEKITTSLPMAQEERKLTGNAYLYLGLIKSDDARREDKIEKLALQDYEKAIDTYSTLINELTAIKKLSDCKTKLLLDTLYNQANTLYRIALIWLNLYNTLRSQLKLNIDPEEGTNHKIYCNRAIGVLEQSIQISNENNLEVDLDIYVLLTAIHFSLKDQVKASLCTSKIIRKELLISSDKDKESYKFSLYNKGLLLYNEKRYEEAKDFFYEYFNYENDDLTVFQRLGDTYLGLKKYLKAKNFYEKSLVKYMNPSSLNGLGLCHLFMNNPKESFRYSEKALESLNLLYILTDKINFDKLDEYNIRTKQLIVESLLIISTSMLKQEKREEAMAYIEKANEVVEHYDLGTIGPYF